MNFLKRLKQHPVFARIADVASTFTKRKGRHAFLHKQKYNFTLLDVGCGDDSPIFCKAAREDCYYIGVDIAHYNQSPRSLQLMDRFLLTESSQFADTIASLGCNVDTVISAHNLEHCDEPYDVLKTMCEVLRPGGNLFLAFPCEQSVAFPKRSGTLCFFDDLTHHNVLQFSTIVDMLRKEGMQIEFAAAQYYPFMPFLVGALLEPISAIRKRVLPFKLTWAFWGFESVIWARKIVDHGSFNGSVKSHQTKRA